MRMRIASALLSLVSIIGLTTPAHADTVGERIVRIARSQVGKPYVAGTQGPSAFDCSGFTQWVIKKAIGKTYVHSSRAQFRSMLHIRASALRPGDPPPHRRCRARHRQIGRAHV